MTICFGAQACTKLPYRLPDLWLGLSLVGMS
jgi:hypothetical protein